MTSIIALVQSTAVLTAVVLISIYLFSAVTTRTQERVTAPSEPDLRPQREPSRAYERRPAPARWTVPAKEPLGAG